jgi:hypothetical protein
MMTGEAVLPDTIRGITDASTTRSPVNRTQATMIAKEAGQF